MADDLLLSFYRLEAAKSGKRTRVLRALPRAGFQEAFLAVQRREDVCRMAVCGFLRDRGSAVLVRRPWQLDSSLALQKVVLLNLERLQELQVEYCPLLRKSEDLALCYEVARKPGGHLLKCQRFCYRALHLDRGGAEEVRRETRAAAATGSRAGGEPGRLVLGGMGALAQLAPAQRSTAEALMAWLAKATDTDRRDGHGDFDDSAEEMSTKLMEKKDLPSSPSGFVEWLARLPKATEATEAVKRRRG
ncbi:unnamed protein product [Effrenium voratum]|nr:unnamed protein product [Effrenium voratum]